MLAARVRCCTEKLIALGCDPAIAKPLFGYWYNYCINGPRPHASVEGVSCQPHTDGQNLAIMMCVLFIYGKCFKLVIIVCLEGCSHCCRRLRLEGESMVSLVGGKTHHPAAHRGSFLLSFRTFHSFQHQHQW